MHPRAQRACVIFSDQNFKPNYCKESQGYAQRLYYFISLKSCSKFSFCTLSVLCSPLGAHAFSVPRSVPIKQIIYQSFVGEGANDIKNRQVAFPDIACLTQEVHGRARDGRPRETEREGKEGAQTPRGTTIILIPYSVDRCIPGSRRLDGYGPICGVKLGGRMSWADVSGNRRRGGNEADRYS